jgi:hypothetical protein
MHYLFTTDPPLVYAESDESSLHTHTIFLEAPFDRISHRSQKWSLPVTLSDQNPVPPSVTGYTLRCLISLDLIALMLFGEYLKLWSSSFCYFISFLSPLIVVRSWHRTEIFITYILSEHRQRDWKQIYLFHWYQLGAKDTVPYDLPVCPFVLWNVQAHLQQSWTPPSFSIVSLRIYM